MKTGTKVAAIALQTMTSSRELMLLSHKEQVMMASLILVTRALTHRGRRYHKKYKRRRSKLRFEYIKGCRRGLQNAW